MASSAAATPRLITREHCYDAATGDHKAANAEQRIELHKCLAGQPIEDQRCLPGGYMYGRDYCTSYERASKAKPTRQKSDTQKATKQTAQPTSKQTKDWGPANVEPRKPGTFAPPANKPPKKGGGSGNSKGIR